MHVWSSFQFLLKHWFWFHWFTLSSSEFLTKGSRQVLLTSKKYIQGGSRRGGNAESSVEKVPGVPGWEQLICGSVIIKCHFLKQAAQDFLAGSLLQSRSKSTVQRIQNFHKEAKLLFCLHFFFNQAPLYLSVLICFCWRKKQSATSW